MNKSNKNIYAINEENVAWKGTKALGRGLAFGVSGVWSALLRGSDKALDRIINEFTLMIIYGQQPKKGFLKRAWDNIRGRGNIVRAIEIPHVTKNEMLDDVNRCMGMIYNMYFRGDITIEQIQGSFSGLGINTALTMASDINTIGKFISGNNIINASDFGVDLNEIPKTNNKVGSDIKDKEEEFKEESNPRIMHNNDDEKIQDPEDNPEPEVENTNDNISDEVKAEFNTLYNDVCYNKTLLYSSAICFDNNCRRHLEAFFEESNDVDVAINKLKNILSGENDITDELIKNSSSAIKGVREAFAKFEQFVAKHDYLKGRTELFESEGANLSIEGFKESLINNFVPNYFNNIISNYTEKEFSKQILQATPEIYSNIQNQFGDTLATFIDSDIDLFKNINYKKLGTNNSTLGLKVYDKLAIINGETSDNTAKKASNLIKKVETKDGEEEHKLKIASVEDISTYLSAVYSKTVDDVNKLKTMFGVTADKLSIPIKRESLDKLMNGVKHSIDSSVKEISTFYEASIAALKKAKVASNKDKSKLDNNYNSIVKNIKDLYKDTTSIVDKKLVENKPTTETNKVEEPTIKDELKAQGPVDVNNIDETLNDIYENIKVIPIYKYIYSDIVEERRYSMELLMMYASGANIKPEGNNLQYLYVAVYNGILPFLNEKYLLNDSIEDVLEKHKDVIKQSIINILKPVFEGMKVNKKTGKELANNIYKNVYEIFKDQVHKYEKVKKSIDGAEKGLSKIIRKQCNKQFEKTIKKIDKLKSEDEQLKQLDELNTNINKKIDSLNLSRVKNSIYGEITKLLGEEFTDDLIKLHYSVNKSHYEDICKEAIDKIKRSSDDVVEPVKENGKKLFKERVKDKLYKLQTTIFKEDEEDQSVETMYNGSLGEKIDNKINKTIKFLKKNNLGIGNKLFKREPKTEGQWERTTNKEQLIKQRDANDDKAIRYVDKFENQKLYTIGAVVKFITKQVDKLGDKFSETNDKIFMPTEKGIAKVKPTGESQFIDYEGELVLNESDLIRIEEYRQRYGGTLNKYIAKSEFDKLDTNAILENYNGTKQVAKKVLPDAKIIELCLLQELTPNEIKINERLQDVFTFEECEMLAINEDLNLSRPINELVEDDEEPQQEPMLDPKDTSVPPVPVSKGNGDALFTINFDTHEIRPNKDAYDIADLHRLISLGSAFADNYLNKSFANLVTSMLKTVKEIATDRDELRVHMTGFMGEFMGMVDAGQDDDNITRMFMRESNLKAANTGQGLYMKRVSNIADKIIASGDKYIKAAGAKYKKKFTKHEVEEFNDFRLTASWEAKKVILQRGANAIFESLYHMPAWSTAIKYYFNYYPVAIYLVTSALANSDNRSIPNDALENAQSILTTKNIK